jgi:hypothetical protein
MANGRRSRREAAYSPPPMIPLERARWKLAIVWFTGCGLLFLTLVLQSMGGAYGDNLQRVWGWALPNFLPTLALMVSVFAADALAPHRGRPLQVRRNFSTMATWLSAFYIGLLLLSVFAQPVVRSFFVERVEEALPERVEMLETSSLWLGPVQGLVVMVMGVLFFLKEDAPEGRVAPPETRGKAPTVG